MEVLVNLTPLIVLVLVFAAFLIIRSWRSGGSGADEGGRDAGHAMPTGAEPPGGVNPSSACPSVCAAADAASITALASRGKRFANLVLDVILVQVFTFAIFFTIGIIGSEAMATALIEMDDTLLGLILVFLYYSVFESIFGRSPAKFITRTRVVTATGGMPSVGRIMLRTLCRFIPFEALSFLGRVPSGWHDKLSKTRVIDG